MKRQYLVEIATPVITPITVKAHNEKEAKMIALENEGEIGDLSYGDAKVIRCTRFEASKVRG